MRKDDMNYYRKWAYFGGFICTANEDGSIPLNSLVVMDCSSCKEEEARRIVAMHNELLYKANRPI